ncbi:hypothetical protein MKK65_06960 [Methylobacterium sp. J-001]|uniref:hypothetical protein n=1 Tax=Methylobacterium sp. J-001 TaxID=2836609 RepID=UPI001FB8C9A8|nr:hypothetical protein [Methylobacterium sp. J-001]MCJ2116318.1 hypothetical protein [Methylobacterium sp. J-001]
MSTFHESPVVVTKLRHLVVFAALVSSCLPLGAQALEKTGSRASLKPFCSADYARLCNGLDLNGPEVVACFRRNAREVSPGCRAAIADYVITASERSALSR